MNDLKNKNMSCCKCLSFVQDGSPISLAKCCRFLTRKGKKNTQPKESMVRVLVLFRHVLKLLARFHPQKSNGWGLVDKPTTKAGAIIHTELTEKMELLRYFFISVSLFCILKVPFIKNSYSLSLIELPASKTKPPDALNCSFYTNSEDDVPNTLRNCIQSFEDLESNIKCYSKTCFMQQSCWDRWSW